MEIQMKMPYGKFKGQPIEELPSNYLHWLAANVDDESKGEQSVCLAADKEYQFRSKNNMHFNEDD